MLLINKHLINILSKVFNKSEKYNEAKGKNNEYGISFSIENEEEYPEAPYYETQN
jgi:hypothetical protein